MLIIVIVLGLIVFLDMIGFRMLQKRLRFEREIVQRLRKKAAAAEVKALRYQVKYASLLRDEAGDIKIHVIEGAEVAVWVDGIKKEAETISIPHVVSGVHTVEKYAAVMAPIVMGCLIKAYKEKPSELET